MGSCEGSENESVYGAPWGHYGVVIENVGELVLRLRLVLETAFAVGGCLFLEALDSFCVCLP